MINGHAARENRDIDVVNNRNRVRRWDWRWWFYVKNDEWNTNSKMNAYLGCSISRFSSGDVSTLTGPVDVKHGGGVTYHDSSIELGNDVGNKLKAPSWEPAAELLRLCLVRKIGLFFISTNGISSSESVCGPLSPADSSRTTINQSSSSSSQLVVVRLYLMSCSSATVLFFCSGSISVGLLEVEFPSKYDANVLNIIQDERVDGCCFSLFGVVFVNGYFFLTTFAQITQSLFLFLLNLRLESFMFI